MHEVWMKLKDPKMISLQKLSIQTGPFTLDQQKSYSENARMQIFEIGIV